MRGQVEAIHVAAAQGAPMEALASVECRTDFGLAGDRYARPGSKGQVTLVSSADLAQAASVLGAPIPPGATRRNVTLSIALPPPGARVRLGDVVLEVTGPAEPCGLMDECVGAGAKEALKGRAGVRARVVAGGTLKVGDAASHESETPSAPGGATPSAPGGAT